MIHVLIERFIADGQLSIYESLCKNALQQSYVEHGFISGEVFYDKKDRHHQYVLCKWRSETDWNRWHASKERLAIVNSISAILVQPERISVLEN